ncbi:putative DNA replication protein [Lacticaseibacillus paracasei]|nr:putative DNA replication protein [Lacticaseibacillus paracasei]
MTSGELVTGAHALAFEMNDGVRRDNQVSWRQVWGKSTLFRTVC